MPRRPKARHAFSLRIDEEIFAELEKFCEDSGQSKTTAVERALMMYFKDYYDRMQKAEKAMEQ